MIRTFLIMVAMLPATALGADCTISSARYEHDQAAWWLSFKPVPRIAASNQTVAFIIEMPNSNVTLEGAVHRPNGFGSPLWSISGPCSEGASDSCRFVEGDATGIYGNYSGKVDWLDDTRGAAAPDQLILPGLSASLWYSMYRELEFEPDMDAGDVFTLTGCD